MTVALELSDIGNVWTEFIYMPNRIFSRTVLTRLNQYVLICDVRRRLLIIRK